MPVENSRFSRPRAISPRASDGTLPCSAVRKRRELATVLLHQVPDPEHDLRALRERGGTPRREGGARRRDRGVDLLDGREVDLPRDLPGRGVEDRAAPAGRARDPPPADPVGNVLGRRGCGLPGGGPLFELGHRGWSSLQVIGTRYRAAPAARYRAANARGRRESKRFREIERPRRRRGLPGAAVDGGAAGQGYGVTLWTMTSPEPTRMFVSVRTSTLPSSTRPAAGAALAVTVPGRPTRRRPRGGRWRR